MTLHNLTLYCLTCTLYLRIFIVTPAEYTFPTPTAVNGSSATGNCTSIPSSTSRALCTDPTSSILFNGHIPTLTGLDGDMWASQLLTMQITPSTDIFFVFRNTPGFTEVERVEIVMFNCPEWGIGVEMIQVFEQNVLVLTRVLSINVTSCDSLVRFCLPYRTTIPAFGLRFLSRDSDWVYLAEVTFFNRSDTCPPDTVISSPLPQPITSTDSQSFQHITLTPNTTGTAATEPRSMDTIVAVTVVIVLFFLLLLLVGVVVVVLVLWRCRHQHTAKEEASHSSQTHTHPVVSLCEETGQVQYVSQQQDTDPSNAYSSLTDQSGKDGAQSHKGNTEYAVLHPGEQPLQKKSSGKKEVNLAVCDPAGHQEEQSQEYSTLYHGEKPVQGASGTGDTSFYETVEQKYQVKTKCAKGKILERNMGVGFIASTFYILHKKITMCVYTGAWMVGVGGGWGV